MQQRQRALLGDGGMRDGGMMEGWRDGGCKHPAESRESRRNKTHSMKTLLDPLNGAPSAGGLVKTQMKNPKHNTHPHIKSPHVIYIALNHCYLFLYSHIIKRLESVYKGPNKDESQPLTRFTWKNSKLLWKSSSQV